MRECGNPTAARARGALGSFFTWAMRMGLVESNPTIGSVAPVEDGGRDRVLSDSELAAVWRACGDDDFGRIIRLLAFGAWRRAEIGDMAWTELDDPEQPATFTVPAARSKNGRAHTLPLTPTMARIIKSVPRMATRDQLFGQRCHGFTRWHSPRPNSMHVPAWSDGRSMIFDGLSPPAWPIWACSRTSSSKMLNHQSGHKAGTAGIYNRSIYANEVRAALLLWEDRVRTLVEGGERKILPYTPTAS